MGQLIDDAHNSGYNTSFPAERRERWNTETLITQRIGSNSIDALVLQNVLLPAYSYFRKHVQDGDKKYIHSPVELPGFPDAKPVRAKTPFGSGKLRHRWEDKNGQILEWDYKKGEIEKYNKRGAHLGAFDPDTGELKKGPIKDRSIKKYL